MLSHSDSVIRKTAWWASGTDRLAFPRRKKPFPQTIGFIGSEELYRLLEPECTVHLLTRGNWLPLLHNGLLDVVLVEPCFRDVTLKWNGVISDAGVYSQAFDDLLGAARKAGVPIVGWITSDIAYWHLHAGFAKKFDRTLCTDPAFASRLSMDGVEAEHLGYAIQSSIHNPFVDLVDREHKTPELLFFGWTSILSNQTIADELRPLVPMGLGIAEGQAYIRSMRKNSTPVLKDAILGCVGPKDRLLLLKSANVLIQADDDLTTRCSAERLALEAAACRCVVVHCGKLEPNDARSKFAHSFASWADLRAFVVRLQSDRLFRSKLAHMAWRTAQTEHSISNALLRILSAVGIEAEVSTPCASIITPSFRPELLAKIIHQYRSQTWSNKELIVVANTNDPNSWQAELIDANNCETIVFLPREHWAGTALNVGARRSNGEYVFRVDDDDYYGENYIKDMMISALSVDADVISKQGEYIYSAEQQKVFRRSHRTFAPTVFPAAEFSYEKVPMAGFAMGMRREVALERGYPDLAYGFADSGFLARERDRGDLIMAMTDNLNAVAERRGDVSTHTWQLQMDWGSKRFEELQAPIDEIMA